MRFRWTGMPQSRRREMRRIVVLGPGCSGKSSLAVRIGEITGLPVVELDKIFWQPGLVETPREQWAEIQRGLVREEGWILDGDLGPYDAVEVRLQAADTIVFLDCSLLRCAWRAVQRSRERADLWFWLLRYRQRSRPFLLDAIARHAPDAALYVLRNPAALEGLVADVCASRS